MDEYDEYFCPHCGAILNEQNGFDPENDTWTCTECGTLLTDEDFFDEEENGVVWYCKNCGAILNKQDGFSKYDSSWMCQECYEDNELDESQIYESEEDYKTKNSLAYNIAYHSTYGILNAVGDSIIKAVSENNKKSKHKKVVQVEESNNKSNGKFENIINVIILVLCISFIIWGWHELFDLKDDELKIRINSSDYTNKGYNYIDVEETLKSNGFTNIKSKPKDDLIFGWVHKEGETDRITINGDDDFHNGDIFKKDSEVIIYYHTFKQ